MTARILLVNNVSAEPFRLVLPDFEARFDNRPPAIAWREAASGDADLALLPVAKLAAAAERMEPIGHFGVACQGPVGSVLFLGRKPLQEVLAAGLPIHLTVESETSRRLLRWLCRQEFGREPALVDDPDVAAGRLAIGDEALRLRQQIDRWPFLQDLCGWWWRRTGLPFVFARWTVKRTSSPAFKLAAARWLADSAAEAGAAAGRERMVERACHAGLFALPAQAHAYFGALRSCFGPGELQGEQTFLQHLQEL